MEGIEEEKHTVVVKWNTNTQCEQTQASTQKHALVGVFFFFHKWKFPYKMMLKWSKISAVDCMGSDPTCIHYHRVLGSPAQTKTSNY